MKVSKEFRFEAAHSLPHLPEGHKCRNLHGHSYRVRLEYEGPVDPDLGWVIDYAEISERWLPLHAVLDHSNLDDILPISTAEMLAEWIWVSLGSELAWTVYVHETSTTCVEYNGE